MDRSLRYRDERRRYPSCVKAVERPTTEFDLEKTRPERAASLTVKLDEAFGFGLVEPSEKARSWWEEKLPVWGIDTTQRQRSAKGE